jgi:hypothetical protein
MLLPHPFLHKYLLNPLLPFREGIPSLYVCLCYAINDVSSRVQIIVNYKDELRATKERLLSKGKILSDRSVKLKKN